MPIGEISLDGLEFKAYHGCYAAEREFGNLFTVSVKLKFEASLPGQSDRLDDTLDYAKVYSIVKEQMEIPSHLLEHVTTRIIEQLWKHFPQVLGVGVEVKKHSPPLGGIVACTAFKLEQSAPDSN